MGSTKPKTLYLAERSIEQFFARNQDVWFITFTQPGGDAPLWTKDQAERALKPFRDLCLRRGSELLVFWELQKRGAWHPHCLVNKRFDVNWVRSWMVARGWGQQMRFEWLTRHRKTSYDGTGSAPTVTDYTPGFDRLRRYLVKYLTKSVVDGDQKHKKCFTAQGGAKCGTVSFKWVPWVKAGSFLYAAGVEFFWLLYNRPPSFKHIGEVVRLGVEATGWASIDPWWEFNFPGG